MHLYCSNCEKHTKHVHLVGMYATRCTTCNCQTSSLERSHTDSLHYTAPDGTIADVVSNRPSEVVFYIPKGQYAGYYHYQKGTGKTTVKQLSQG